MVEPRKQVMGLKDEIETVAKELIHKAKLYNHLKVKVLDTFRMYVCDVRNGRTSYGKKYLTVPKWAYEDKREGYFVYYVAHELAHAFSYLNGTNDQHGKHFYHFYSKLCPVEYQHYELEYKIRNAKRFGINE